MFSGKNRIVLFSCIQRFLYCFCLCIFEYIFLDFIFTERKINFFLDFKEGKKKKKKSEIWFNDFNFLNKYELNLEYKFFFKEKIFVQKGFFQYVNS